jgi:Ras-related protein Rab-6A
MFIETSAKAGFNIKALFRKVASALPGLQGNAVATEKRELDLQPTPSATPPAAGGCASSC